MCIAIAFFILDKKRLLCIHAMFKVEEIYYCGFKFTCMKAYYNCRSIVDQGYGYCLLKLVIRTYLVTLYVLTCKLVYRIVQNVGGGKHWRIWRLSIDSPKFSHPSIVNTLKCNGKPTQFAKVLPSNYMSRVISPKFTPANILRYMVFTLVGSIIAYCFVVCYIVCSCH